ncbi:MAG: metallophosphoesterase [Verrucomicrobiales bacterium]|nr:metallophosphoesterase [Verrucomicrobiales bacterium]
MNACSSPPTGTTPNGGGWSVQVSGLARRRFLGALGLGSALAAGARRVWGDGAASRLDLVRRRGGRMMAQDDVRVRFFREDGGGAFKVLMIADTHLFTDDARGEAFRPFSGRMAKAYNATKHFKTGQPTHPQEALVQSLALAREERVDLVALVGDIVSFPSEAAVEWVGNRMAECGLPYVYVAGNHDWHYEGMEGSLASLRETWINRRLSPLYQGANPLNYSRVVKGIRFVVIDNSTYEILPEQLRFFREQARQKEPMVLLVHIPLYAPGRGVGFGCGHPDWGAKTDRSYELERRPRWPAEGHTRTTMAFHREVFSTPQLLGVFAGHIHKPSLDVYRGVPQFVADANAMGAYLLMEFVPSTTGKA